MARDDKKRKKERKQRNAELRGQHTFREETRDPRTRWQNLKFGNHDQTWSPQWSGVKLPVETPGDLDGYVELTELAKQTGTESN